MGTFNFFVKVREWWDKPVQMALSYSTTCPKCGGFGKITVFLDKTLEDKDG